MLHSILYYCVYSLNRFKVCERYICKMPAFDPMDILKKGSALSNKPPIRVLPPKPIKKSVIETIIKKIT